MLYATGRFAVFRRSTVANLSASRRRVADDGLRSGWQPATKHQLDQSKPLSLAPAASLDAATRLRPTPATDAINLRTYMRRRNG